MARSSRVGGKEGCYEIGPSDLPGFIADTREPSASSPSSGRLVPKATSFRTIVSVFNSTADACGLVADVIAAGMLPAAMEMLDGRMIELVESNFHFGFPRRNRWC
jgi:hypothetical protein